jgi:hypothetical protein
MRRLGFLLLAASVAAVGCNLTINVPKRPTEATETTPTSAPVDDRNTNYRPDQSVLRNTKRAGDRAAMMNDISQLGLLINALDLLNNKMPTKAEIMADLEANVQARDILKKIKEGVIILTGSTNRDGLWAYEVDADKVGGIVYYGGRAERATAEDVKKYLATK